MTEESITEEAQHRADRIAAQEIAKTVMDLIKDIWATNPQKHLLSQLAPGDASESISAAKNLTDHLDNVIQALEFKSNMEILMWLRTTSSARDYLPSWSILLEDAHKLLALRHGIQDADRKLRGLRAKTVI